MIGSERKYLRLENWVAWGSFALLLLTYWLTVAPTISFWDCPEYVSAAYLLEVGHPPGNPTWMLVEKMFTLLAPSPAYAALAINLSSGLFTAFAAFFLAKTLYRVGLWVLLKLPRRHIPAPVAAAGGALCGALAFGWCDSAWFSAVEAEVYAMSIFMTALCVWLMTKWAGTRNRPESWRLLILIAYLFGLSIGIHQLNLLCIPALAMIWAVRRGIRSTLRLSLIFLLSLVAVACVLMGMMPSTIALAARFEIMAVNLWGLPALNGVAIYVGLLALALILALVVTRVGHSRSQMAAACFPAIFLSGIFILSDHFVIGAIVSALVSALLVSGTNFQSRRLCLALWMLAMLLTGYSSYALIPIRGDVPSPANSAMPGEPFAFAYYQSREQYGGKPLLYGPTPFSKPMLHEEYDSLGKPFYRKYQLKYGSTRMVPGEAGGKLRSSLDIAPADSVENARLAARGGDSYMVIDRHPSTVKTPELNMWFPRITSSNPSDLTSFDEWIGMNKSSMAKVRISEAFDSLGRPVVKARPDGSRGDLATGFRPTYMQNLQWFLTYQTGYMYWRYLLWNFAGRQNDRPSQGEVQHGNFVTGFRFIDNAMLGAEDHLPAVAGKDNKGRNLYYCLPLVLGLIGIGWLLKSRRRGITTCAVTGILFVMTGLAIVVYLNQDPGEPRERDYSFLGSFWAYCIWIGFGAIMLARRFRSPWGFALPLAIVGWMGFTNYDDHDRSNRTAAHSFAINMMQSMEPDAIIFVNGDNYTFPLWYIQEVEGVRSDIRVVNLSYLTRPAYAANLMADWRESAKLPTTLSRKDIIYDAYQQVRISPSAVDTMPALEALRILKQSDRPQFPAHFVTITDTKGNTISIPANALRNGRLSLDFGRLMMLDILATNAASPNPRPIYWIEALSADKRLGLSKELSPWLFGYQFGIAGYNRSDSLAIAASERMVPANPPGKPVYMDHTPASQLSSQRAALVAAGRRLLDHGNIAEAVKMAQRADYLMGYDPGTYVNVLIGDTTFVTRRELASLLTDCAYSLLNHTNDKKPEHIVLELKSRGSHHMKEYQKHREDWINYKRHLPPRLRNKMAPTY